MGMLEEATGCAYAKVGILGFQGGGKTFTAAELAIFIRAFFKLQGPIAMFDTEHGSDAIEAKVLAKTGLKLLRKKSRSLDDLLLVAKECEKAGVSVFITDSLTHIWKEVLESYLVQRAEKHREQKRKLISDSLDADDWARIKGVWQRWPDWFVNSPMHVIACGRAGWEYAHEPDDDGKSELVKVGVRMKAETEFGYEPNLLVEMQRDFVRNARGEVTDGRETFNRAVVLKDRLDVIDGKACDNPTPEFFLPHLRLLDPGNHRPIVTVNRTRFLLDGENRDDWERERESRTIAAEKIKAALARARLDGQSADEKKRRAEVLERFWGTDSWTEISQRLPSRKLLDGLEMFRAEVLAAPEDDNSWRPEPNGAGSPTADSGPEGGEPAEMPRRKRRPRA